MLTTLSTDLLTPIRSGPLTAEELVRCYAVVVFRETASYQETARRLVLFPILVALLCPIIGRLADQTGAARWLLVGGSRSSGTATAAASMPWERVTRANLV